MQMMFSAAFVSFFDFRLRKRMKSVDGWSVDRKNADLLIERQGISEISSKLASMDSNTNPSDGDQDDYGKPVSSIQLLLRTNNRMHRIDEMKIE